MTVDISELNKLDDHAVKSCETCKCLTCDAGKMFNARPCPKGKNCSNCNGKEPATECNSFKTGF